MRLLITGATGFIGTHLVEHFKKLSEVDEIITVGSSYKSHTKITLDRKLTRSYWCDLSVKSEVDSMFSSLRSEGKKIDAVIHLAGQANPRLDPTNPGRIWESNVIATQNLLENMNPSMKMVFASSIVVYGWTSEHAFSELDTPHPTSVYGLTKYASEQLLYLYRDQKGVDCRILRLPAVVGTGLTHGILRDFIIKAKNDNPEFPIFGDPPGSTKPYLHVSDVCQAFEMMTTTPSLFFNTLNFSASNEISCDVIADLVMSECGVEKKKVWQGATVNIPGDSLFLRANPKRAYADGWKPKYKDSESAICRAVKDILDAHSY